MKVPFHPFRATKIPKILIGLHDTDTEGKFHWYRPALNGGYKHWCRGEPNNYKSGEDCAELYVNCLNDIPCKAEQPFICETNHLKKSTKYM